MVKLLRKNYDFRKIRFMFVVELRMTLTKKVTRNSET